MDGDCDGIEVFNDWAMTGIQNRRADAFATRPGYPKLAGSDAHNPGTVGSAYTEVSVGTASPSVEELLDAVTAGRTRAVGQSASTRRYVRKYTRAVRRRLRTGGRTAGGPVG